MSDISTSPNSQPKKKSLFKRPLFLGCFGLLVVTLLVIGGFIIWLFVSGKTVISNTFRDEIIAEVESSDLPLDQKEDLIEQVNRVTDGFQEGDVSLKELTLIIEQLAESPAMSVLKIESADGDPIASSNFSSDEKAAAHQTINRFVYGVFEERIPASAINELIDPLLLQPSKREDWKFRSDISEEELRTTIEQAKRYADDAGIGNANLSPDVAGEVSEVIDRVLSAQE